MHNFLVTFSFVLQLCFSGLSQAGPGNFIDSAPLARGLTSRAARGAGCTDLDWRRLSSALTNVVRITNDVASGTRPVFPRYWSNTWFQRAFDIRPYMDLVDLRETQRVVYDRFRAVRWEARRSAHARHAGRVRLECEHAPSEVCPGTTVVEVRGDRIFLVCLSRLKTPSAFGFAHCSLAESPRGRSCLLKANINSQCPPFWDAYSVRLYPTVDTYNGRDRNQQVPYLLEALFNTNSVIARSRVGYVLRGDDASGNQHNSNRYIRYALGSLDSSAPTPLLTEYFIDSLLQMYSVEIPGPHKGMSGVEYF